MAKKQEVVEILLKLSDGGTIPVLGKKAKKAGKEVDDMGRKAQNTDRAVKGLTQQSSNQTKEFSKLATMQGGLVQVYATIAAQVFAVSAAFQFLKSSMEMRNLIEGQMAFGATTGVAYRTLTHDIQKATGGMLQFKEAAQAAAIGTAAGLSAGQMEQIGVAAKNTSLALGRDLTDSFNRLTRGITKAEPELLDELGIVLRLEPAMKAYANSIQKNVKDLTQFEKSQAVANEVLEQAETKFGAITKIMDPSAFALQQFAVAFDELMMKVQKGTAEFMIPIMQFASENVMALVGALTLFLAPILKSILPDFEAMATAAQTNFSEAALAADDAAMAFERAKAASKQAGGADMGPSQSSKDYMSKHKIKAGKGMPEGQLSKRQLEIRKRHLKEGVGFAKNMNRRQLADYKKFLIDQEIALSASQGKKQALLKRTELQFKAHTARMVMIFRQGQQMMVAIQARAAKLMNGAMRLMGWAGIILMIGQAVVSLYEWIVGVDEAAKAEKELAEGIEERYGGLTQEIEKMNDVQNAGLLGFRGSIEQIGNAFASTDVKKSMEDYAKALTIKDDFNRVMAIAEISTSLKNLADLSGDAGGEIKAVYDQMAKHVPITEASATALEALGLRMQAGAAASKNFSQTSKALSASLRGLAGSAKKLPFANQIENLRTMVNNSASMLSMGQVAIDAQTDNRDAAQAQVNQVKANQDAVRRAKEFQQAHARAYNNRSQQNPYTDADMDALAQQYGFRSRADASWIANRSEDVFADSGGLNLEAALKELEKQQKVLDDMNASKKTYTDQQKEEQELLTTMLQKQIDQKGILTDQLALQIDMASKGMSTGVAAKQAQEEFKNTKANLDLRQKTLDLEMAELALTAIKDDASEEEKKAAAFLVEQKKDMVELSTAQQTQTALEVKFNKLKIEQNHELLLLKEKEADLERKRKLESAQNEAALMTAGTHAEVRLLNEQKVTHMQEKQSEAIERRKTLEEQLKTFRATAGFDEEEARKRQEAINALKDEELITEQMITNEIMKQQGMDLIGKTDRGIDSNRMKLSNMRGGGNFLGMGLGNVTPQGVELNKLLAQHNTDVATASTTTLENGKNQLEVLKAQAVAQADLNTEIELANSTASILQNGFVSMFQAMIDGTKSFGDAMKDVMKQVLADLAAAYMRAAALKMLQAMGLPGLPGARYGGVMSASGKSYATGGIAHGPQSGYMATLHGTEAVVPLGNDRSIPVEMRGGMGGNVVNVTVNMSGGQANTTTTGDGQMQGLGRAIGGLVQQHLQQEMRPGGLLNQQGTKGRT